MELDNEVTETQAAQIQLDKTAEDFKALHAERQELVGTARLFFGHASSFCIISGLSPFYKVDPDPAHSSLWDEPEYKYLR